MSFCLYIYYIKVSEDQISFNILAIALLFNVLAIALLFNVLAITLLSKLFKELLA
jgi:hypothetical protein